MYVQGDEIMLDSHYFEAKAGLNSRAKLYVRMKPNFSLEFKAGMKGEKRN